MATTNNGGIDLSGYVVRNADGSIDVQQTHVKFTSDLNKFLQMEKADSEVIAKAVEKVWQDNPDQKTLPMGAVVHYAMQNLEYSPEAFNDLSERVANFIRSKPAIYKIGKGKGGGVSRVVHEGASSTPPQGGSIRPKATGTAG